MCNVKYITLNYALDHRYIVLLIMNEKLPEEQDVSFQNTCSFKQGRSFRVL